MTFATTPEEALSFAQACLTALELHHRVSVEHRAGKLHFLGPGYFSFFGTEGTERTELAPPWSHYALALVTARYRFRAFDEPERFILARRTELPLVLALALEAQASP